MEKPLIQLVYVSTARFDDIESELLAIQNAAVRNNREDVITGVLLHRSGRFLQLLEGDPDNVIPLYERILEDPRHTDCRLLVQRECSERSASSWSMGVLNLDGVSSDFDQIFDAIIAIGNETHNFQDEEYATQLVAQMTSAFAGYSEAA
jgi:hypothetical protein